MLRRRILQRSAKHQNIQIELSVIVLEEALEKEKLEIETEIQGKETEIDRTNQKDHLETLILIIETGIATYNTTIIDCSSFSTKRYGREDEYARRLSGSMPLPPSSHPESRQG